MQENHFAIKCKVGSMFAGIGGICLGFKQADFNVVWANEKDKKAIETYRHNFGDSYLVDGDIRKVDAKTIPDIDVLTAGFPCQSFSVAGKQRGVNDSRGNLFFEVVRVIDAKRPRFVFLENVANLKEHDDGKTFLVIYNALVQFGYFVKYKVLDARKYANVPQKRERIFIVAFRNLNDCQNFVFPDEVSLTTMLEDIIDLSQKHSDCYYYNSESNYYPQLIKRVMEKNLFYRINDSGIPSKGSPTCQTLVASMGAFFDRVPIIKDDFGIRRLTPQETLLLQGFPANYIFPKATSQRDAYTQAGNSVCVPLIERIAVSIKELIDEQF